MIAEAPARPAPATLPVASIRVGKRFRKDLGDLEVLRQSIATVGLLHPVVVDLQGNLIAGLRRLQAVQALGWKEVPVRAVDLDGSRLYQAERDENLVRKDFLPTEAVAIARAIRGREAEAAGERRKAGLRQGMQQAPARSGQCPERDRGETRERVAAAVGVSDRTLRRAEAVVVAGEKDPRKYGPLVEEMDRSRNVNGAFKVLQGRRSLASLKSSDSVEWYTPPEYVDLVHQVLGEIDLDPASSEVANRTVKAKRFYTAAEDGLRQPWAGKVFCNPPYGGAQKAFAARLLEEYGEDRVREGIILLNANAIETAWFRPLWGFTLCFIYGRINFLGPAKGNHGPTHGTVLAYLGANWKKFAEAFAPYGAVVRKVVP